MTQDKLTTDDYAQFFYLLNKATESQLVAMKEWIKSEINARNGEAIERMTAYIHKQKTTEVQ